MQRQAIPCSGKRDENGHKQGETRLPEQADTDDQVYRADKGIDNRRLGQFTVPQGGDLCDARQSDQQGGKRA